MLQGVVLWGHTSWEAASLPWEDTKPETASQTRVIQMSPPTRETGNNGIPMSQSLPFFRGRGVGRKDLTDRSSSLQGEGRGRLENQEGAVTQQLLISIH